jgi:hypothetical protein
MVPCNQLVYISIAPFTVACSAEAAGGMVEIAMEVRRL